METKTRQVVVNAEREANRKKWQAELTAWRGSGKPLSTWARERGLSRDALQYWKEKLSGTPRESTQKLTLIPVSRITRPQSVGEGSLSLSSGVPIELHLGDCRLILAQGFDPDSLRAVLAVLAPC